VDVAPEEDRAKEGNVGHARIKNVDIGRVGRTPRGEHRGASTEPEHGFLGRGNVRHNEMVEKRANAQPSEAQRR